MPDKFEFLPLDAFKKLTSNERQAYLEKVARYLGALTADLDDQEGGRGSGATISQRTPADRPG